jgi:hypothetical protein
MMAYGIVRRGRWDMALTLDAAAQRRAAPHRRVAARAELVAWAWINGYISDAQYERLIAALAREVAAQIAPPRAVPPQAV